MSLAYLLHQRYRVEHTCNFEQALDVAVDISHKRVCVCGALSDDLDVQIHSCMFINRHSQTECCSRNANLDIAKSRCVYYMALSHNY